MRAEDIRRAYLEKVRSLRHRLAPHAHSQLRDSANVESVVAALRNSSGWETRHGKIIVVLTERWTSRKAHHPYVEFVPELVRARVSRLHSRQVFLGCRFKEPHKSLLEWNLRNILRCYGLELVADDSDCGFRELFSGIIKKIQRSPLCLFDAKHTYAKPNVFIECGVSFALRKRTMLAVPANYRPFFGKGAASDFHGMIYTPYGSYEDLMNKVSLWIPQAIGRSV